MHNVLLFSTRKFQTKDTLYLAGPGYGDNGSAYASLRRAAGQYERADETRQCHHPQSDRAAASSPTRTPRRLLEADRPLHVPRLSVAYDIEDTARAA